MIDQRIYTFLKLCDLMNYRKTADALLMTQPAVTQHIQHLEKTYGCKLFSYNGRTLSKTAEGEKLEHYARSILYNEKHFRESLKAKDVFKLSVGATKTVGDYYLQNKILDILKSDNTELKLIIDNTENLLTKLNALELDLLLIEGFADKNIYAHEIIKSEELVGICSKDHPFAGKEIRLEDIFNEHIILREEGSGTRAVFENFLTSHGYNEFSFKRKSQISSFNLITKAASQNLGISFVYESVAKSCDDVSVFRIKGNPIYHEFNCVYLKDADVKRQIDLLK